MRKGEEIMKKKFIALLLISVMALSLTACSSLSDGKRHLIGVDSAGRGAAGQLFGEPVAEKLNDASGGTMVLDYFPNGTLGDDATLLRQTSPNWLQLAVSQTAPVVSLIPEMGVFDLPMVFAK